MIYLIQQGIPVLFLDDGSRVFKNYFVAFRDYHFVLWISPPFLVFLKEET